VVKKIVWRVIKVSLCLLLAFIVAAILLLWLIFSGSENDFVDNQTLKNSFGGETQSKPMTRDELKRFELERDSLARLINREIREYYKQSGYYPKSLNVLQIAKTEEYSRYHKGISYGSGIGNNKPAYKLSWLASSPWNGMQCVSGFKLTQELGGPFYDNCYVLDYH
jgi:hypothetical protein